MPGDFAAALARIRAAIGNYARRLGKADRYHETMTVAYLALIQHHMYLRGDGGGWPGFAHENPELFQPDLLMHFYSRAQLQSELARRVFVLPSPASPRDGECA